MDSDINQITSATGQKCASAVEQEQSVISCLCSDGKVDQSTIDGIQFSTLVGVQDMQNMLKNHNTKIQDALTLKQEQETWSSEMEGLK